MGLLERIIPPMSRDKFARSVLRAIRKKNPASDATYNPADFSITQTRGGTTFLSNAYEEYRRSPVFKRRRTVAFYAAFQPTIETPMPDTFAGAAPFLLPKVRERFYHEAVRFRTPGKDGKGLDIPLELLNEHLTVELIYDTPTSMAIVGKTQLEKWQTSFESAMKTARDNLWKISNQEWLQPGPGLFIAPWKDFHAASRLFLHDLVWQLPVKGAHVAMVPNRNSLFVAGDQDDAALLAMAALAERELSQPRFMTATAFRLNGSRWEHFLPPRSSPTHAKFRELYIKSMGQMYAEQKELLEKDLKDKGDPNPPFVASLSGVTSPAGELVTFATWAEDVETLLPDADCIALGGRKGEKYEKLGFLDRATLHRAFGDLLKPMPCYPPRWEVKAFPSRDRLASLPMSPEPIRGES